MSTPLARITQLLFGSTGPVGDFGIFGSKAAGDPAFSQDPNQIQSLPAFTDGWGESIIGDYDPPLEDMNSLFLLAFRQIAYIFQQGISEYDPNINYFIGSLAMQNGILYISQIASNKGNNPSTDNGTNWKSGIGGINGGVPTGGIIKWGGAVNAIPSGYLLGDGRAVSRTTYVNLFNTIGTVYGSGDGTTTFNLPDGRGKFLVGTLTGDPNFGTIGVSGGSITISIDQLPPHEHGIQIYSGGGADFSQVAGTGANSPATQSTESTGEGEDFIPPFLVVGGIIIKY